ncbi:MAG: transcriptional regulator [Flavobacteriaceae bacterium]|nr:transcriptional regulator [Flavobacteriaceae bacterium]
MNYIKHLTGFFDKVVSDKSLNPTHISLYIGLFQYWNVNRFQNPISITRNEIMSISKIASKATYHKCMRDLHDNGYIKYEPSYNPFKGSMVILFNLAEDAEPVQKKDNTSKKILPINEQVAYKQQTSNDTSNEQALVSSINNTNNTNDLNLLENKNQFLKNQNKSAKEEKSAAKKEEKNSPTIEEVKTYFQENNFPEIEANKFFNYYSNNGWLIGGKTPMQNWKTASQNWMLNYNKFNPTESPTKTNHLTTTTNKDYSEPL